MKSYRVRDGTVVSIIDAVMLDVEGTVEKSAANSSNHFDVFLTTFDSLNSYKTYTFALNELEAGFDISTDEIDSITLRDTSVHKKIEFAGDKGTLVHARGQDIVGLHSEVNSLTTREPIYSIIINGSKFEHPFDLPTLYLELTGVDLSVPSTHTTESSAEANWWGVLVDETIEN